MKRVLITTLLLTSFSVLFTQTAVVKIEGSINSSTIDNFIKKGNCKEATGEYPSLMAIEIVKQIIADIKAYKSYGVLMKQGGSNKEVSWIISRSPNQNRLSENIDLSINTDKEPLGDSIAQYMHQYTREICFRWRSLIKYSQTNGIVVYRRNNQSFIRPNKVNRKPPRENRPSRPKPKPTPRPPLTSNPRYLGDVNSSNAVMLPSSRLVLPTYLFRDISYVGQVSELMDTAFHNCNYTELKYFEYPNGGFEIFTKIEKIDKTNGTHLRWADVNRSRFNLSSLVQTVKSLLFEDEGLYRMFIIKYDPGETTFKDSRGRTSSNMQSRFAAGRSGLSEATAQKRLAFSSLEDSKISFLVYEFEYSSTSDDIRLLLDKNYFTAREHLEKTLLWNEFHRLTDSRP